MLMTDDLQDFSPAEIRDASGQILEDLIQLVARSRQQSYEYMERFGVTVPQSGVLKALDESGSLPIGTLAEKLLLRTSTVSGIVDRLERDGHVTRVRGNADRRVVHVELTPQGERLCAKLPGSSFDKVRRALDRLDHDEARAFLTLLRRVLDYIRQEGNGNGDRTEGRSR